MQLPASLPSGQETSSVYIRKVFDEKAFFSFPGLSPDTFLYVLDSKTLAGREPRDEADAQSSSLVLCFFKKICEDEGEITVERLEKTFHGMTPRTLTCAEILLTLGYHLPVEPARSAALAGK